MKGNNWSRQEVEAVIDDYLSMLACELAGTPYSKTAHRRALLPRLHGRTEQSIEFKHGNISAALLDLGCPPIPGYKPRANYQSLLSEVLAERMSVSPQLSQLAAADADRPIVVPEVDDILAVLTSPPRSSHNSHRTTEPPVPPLRPTTNYLEREARNRSLGSAGELFVLNYERARLVRAGKDELAGRIEHTSMVRGDHEGYDVLSFEETGEERLIEVKTTKYLAETPFFVTRNEVETSARNSSCYHVYRLYRFREAPKLYTLCGAIGQTCHLSAATFLAAPK
jgi:hypothetical protein